AKPLWLTEPITSGRDAACLAGPPGAAAPAGRCASVDRHAALVDQLAEAAGRQRLAETLFRDPACVAETVGDHVGRIPEPLGWPGRPGGVALALGVELVPVTNGRADEALLVPWRVKEEVHRGEQ